MLGKILGGRYELLEKIGGGGMAVVYKAKCHLLKRYVAVKVLRPELVENEEFVARFKRESQSVASLSHQNIVNIYDVGQEDDIHYIVMEYIDGKTLKEYIHDKGRLDNEEAVRICIQICAALNHAHKNNIVHRDIKPQNILINQEGLVKVADFGIARAITSATVTMAGANVIGSVHYFSPEQARGGIVDKKSDIYSLGIVLYEMVTGVVPFEGDSAISVALKHIQEKVTPPGEINPDIPQSIQNIIEKAIEKDLDNRYHDAAEMMADLKRAIKEPDGNYIKKYNDDQATLIVPAVHVEDDFKEEKQQKGNKDPNKKRNIIMMGASFLLIFTLLLVLFLVGRSIFMQNFVSDEVKVPLIEGYDESVADSILKSSGLNLNITEWKPDNEVPEGEIISQDPKEGMKVKLDSAVDAVVSRGVEKVVVPDVVNWAQRDAEVELENWGLKVGEPDYIFSDIPSGYVVKQKTPAHTEVIEGTEIVLVISKGSETTSEEVGTYTGQLEEIAREMILDDNLT
ncbi:MAG: Stk1 family PASTA domain-containing Ser/Thr kinase, partial [Firmicutes bacterium]|nr:Stk1 family PASTA domain-containing Ser/Thr kinase [Bacillota bacterium]